MSSDTEHTAHYFMLKFHSQKLFLDPVIIIRASYNTGRNADPKLRVWVTGRRRKLQIYL